jgi:hypothetical protein
MPSSHPSSEASKILCLFHGCRQSFTTLSNKKRHLAQTHFKRQFKCSHCSTFPGSRRVCNLYKHQLKTHPQIFNGVYPRFPPSLPRCSVCLLPIFFNSNPSKYVWRSLRTSGTLQAKRCGTFMMVPTPGRRMPLLP